MKSILKKLCKAALALTLAFTGVLFTTKDARAAENETDIELYATPQSRTDRITVSGSRSQSVTLALDFYIDATGLMDFTGRVTCTPNNSGQICSLVSTSSSGESQSGTTTPLYVNVTYRSRESDGEIWQVRYQFKYTNNTLRERTLVSETRV